MKKQLFLPFAVFSTFLSVFSIWSYGLTAPNLVLSAHPFFWQFQTYMWEMLFNNRPFLAGSYLLLTTLLISSWVWVMRSTPKVSISELLSQIKLSQGVVVLSILSATLLFANTALSYDVFNYIFNARMVVEYQANPHVAVALDFADDPWTRFMHNTHTPAPYGYGWTTVSLLPYLAGLEIFSLTWLLFRMISILSWLGLVAVIIWAVRNTPHNPVPGWVLPAVVCNPLLLLEILAMMHNDLWMMVPAVLSLLLATRDTGNTIHSVFLQLFLLAFSVSIKLATVVVLPVWILLQLRHYEITPLSLKKKILHNWALFASMLLFVPLLTLRSQLFHPWYLTWVLVWLPLLNWRRAIDRVWARWVIVLSISSLYRYVPYLAAGEFSDSIILQQRMITFGGALLLFVAWAFWEEKYTRQTQ